tara:strand:- start:40 stop:315 length:276 start_codon:yes stop_codon:yes gene_type:complete
MNKIYNFRIGDMIYRDQNGKSIVGLIYKMTPKYIYYAVMATNGDGLGPAYMTKDHKVLKTRLYRSLKNQEVFVSYARGVGKRRKIEDFGED